MINKLLSSDFAKTELGTKLRKSGLANWFKGSWFFRVYNDSAGDWRYPLFCMNWLLANFLRRWRRAKMGEVQFYLPCENPYTHMRLYTIAHKEPEVRLFLDQYLEDDDILFDVGANIGILSLYSALSKKRVTAYAFEPEYSTLGLLKEAVIKNKLPNQIFPYGLGISDFVGLSRLHLQSLEAGAAAHSESQDDLDKTQEGYAIVGTEGIAAVTLDYLVEELQVVPNLIKIDTDGNELKILKGATQLLQNPKLRGLIIECPFVEETNHACRQLLTAAGFSEIALTKDSQTENMGWLRNSSSN